MLWPTNLFLLSYRFSAAAVSPQMTQFLLDLERREEPARLSGITSKQSFSSAS